MSMVIVQGDGKNWTLREYFYKLGKENFTSAGPPILTELSDFWMTQALIVLLPVLNVIVLCLLYFLNRYTRKLETQYTAKVRKFREARREKERIKLQDYLRPGGVVFQDANGKTVISPEFGNHENHYANSYDFLLSKGKARADMAQAKEEHLLYSLLDNHEYSNYYAKWRPTLVTKSDDDPYASADLSSRYDLLSSPSQSISVGTTSRENSQENTTENATDSGGGCSKDTGAATDGYSDTPGSTSQSDGSDHSTKDDTEKSSNDYVNFSPNESEESSNHYVNSNPEKSEESSNDYVNFSPNESEESSNHYVNPNPEESEESSNDYANSSPKESEESSNHYVNSSPKESEESSNHYVNSSPKESEESSNDYANSSPKESEESSNHYANPNPEESEESSNDYVNSSPKESEESSNHYVNYSHSDHTKGSTS